MVAWCPPVAEKAEYEQKRSVLVENVFFWAPLSQVTCFKSFFSKRGNYVVQMSDPDITLGVEEIPGDKLELGGEASDLRVKGVF